LSNDVSPLAIVVPILDNRADDITDNPEGALGGASKRPGLLAYSNDLHLRLPALGDGDGLAAFGDFVDQGKAARLEGSGVDLAIHGKNPK
jgi:hypothetical protein